MLDIQALLASFGSKLHVKGWSKGTKSGVSDATKKTWHMILVADGTAERSFLVEAAIANVFPPAGTIVSVAADYTVRDGRTFLNNPQIKVIDPTAPAVAAKLAG